MSNCQPVHKSKNLQTSTYLNLKFAYLSVKWEGVEEHGADEGDVGGLAVVDPLPGVYPQSSQFGENINCLEGFQVVDEDVWNP